MNYKEKYIEWLENPDIDDETKNELKQIENDENEIKDRFFKDLEFGTGGLRGVIGAGTNRMNRYTVARATQGLSDYILKQDDGEKRKSMGVAIAYDSRNKSPEFAEYAALVLNANGIKSYLFKSLRPTPELSFAVRELKATAGIVITASHNPPEYNGYKMYWEDGGQATFPRDEAVMEEVNKITNLAAVRFADKGEAVQNGLFNYIGEEIDDKYIEKVKEQCFDLDSIKAVADDFRIVFTPLNGAGSVPVTRVLNEVGFKNVYVVPEQEQPDPLFSTLKLPNPEDPEAFTLAIALAKKVNADIIIGTDPDSDRMGAVVKNGDGYVALSGNIIGALLTEYVLSKRKERNNIPHNGVVIKTIVTTEIITQIARRYGAGVIDVLTGFKYIGEKIKEFEETGSNEYLFGYEESYGYLCGTHARDKDAVVSSMLICEFAASLKRRGRSLYGAVSEMYAEYGYYKETVNSIALKGADGLEKTKRIMETLRKNLPKTLGDNSVTSVGDYKSRKLLYTQSGETEEITLPVSDVLKYRLDDDSWACIRPSGTEPKIKVYFGVKGESSEEAAAKTENIESDLMRIINGIE